MTKIEKVFLPSNGQGKDPNDHGYDPDIWDKVERAPTALDRLRKLSATNRISEMEVNLQNEEYIFPELALSGQITLFYAAPNTGKTLLFLKFIRDVINEGRVKAEDVFYINADDSYKGLFTKVNIARQHGFEMISPAEAGISPQHVLELLADISEGYDAIRKVILLDTLKKFADMMSKKSLAGLFENLRRFVAKGGTVILAGHANKHKNAEGELVYEGTSDTMSDVDCVYSIYRMTNAQDETQSIEFRREKDRGNVAAKVSYQYRKTGNYHAMLDSISRIDDEQAKRAATERRQDELKVKHEVARCFVEELLCKQGALNQSAIVRALADNIDLKDEITERGLKTALKSLKDICWTTKRGANNATVYNLIGADAREYQRSSDGE